MKKILLFALAIGIGLSSMAQQAYKIKIDTKSQKKIEKQAFSVEPIKSTAITKSQTKAKLVIPAADRDANIVTIVPIGTAANAYGFSGSQNPIPVRPDLNTVAFIHRMGGDLDPGGYSGDMGYDVSMDGGQTWTTQAEFWVAIDNEGGTYFKDAGRYPSAGIANPEGGNGPYLNFYFPLLWDSNGGWCGYGVGVANLNDPTDATRNLITYDETTDLMISVPGGYGLSSQGFMVGVDDDYDVDGTTYNGALAVTTGVWNDDAMDYLYAIEGFDLDLSVSSGSADQKVAFSPDGQIGYICVLGNDGEAEQLSGYSNYYPIILKTTDGGATWSDPTFIQLDGPDGLGGIVYNHLTDQLIADLFEPPVPTREEISYTTAFEHDLAVDANGNLHIGVLIGPTGSDPQSIISASGYTAVVDIFTTDGGTTWFVEEMGRPNTFRGTFCDISSDNRVKITSTPSANKFFFSWLDTDIEDAEDNDRPNIWCRGFDPATYMKTSNGDGDGPTNVTLFSSGMWQSYYGTAGNFCFTNENGYNIPFIFQEMDPADPIAPVQFQYIQDFYFTDADFTIQGINNPVVPENNLSSVSQNFPNPFNNETYVTVSLNEGSNLSLEVYTLTGQKVVTKDYGYMANGSHTLTISGTDLTSGVYFYTVTAGENKVTRKMIVE